MWVHGTINGMDYDAKVFDSGSVYGINGGRISKLYIVHNGKCVVNYDRGWDVTPTTPEAIEVLNVILAKYAEV